MKHLQILSTVVFLTVITSEAIENGKPAPAIARTEIRVAKSLNPDDTQTLNVMTRDGNVAQLIVKRRDAKSKLSTPTTSSSSSSSHSRGNGEKDVHQLTRSFYSNWLPVQSVYLQPNLIRLNTYATLMKNGTEEKSINNNIGSVVDSDRIPHVPKSVTIRSGDVFIKPSNDQRNNKKGRSLMEVDRDGIPVVHGVRMPDDETDDKVWRNARVINGELVPYEKGYKPPAAVPLGQLVYPNKVSTRNDEDSHSRGIGPYTTSDNFHSSTGFGPFTVNDNNRAAEKPHTRNPGDGYVKFSSSEGGMGPFTVADNSRKLVDYIKEINTKESNKDYFTSRRKYRSYETTEAAPQIQRRMLHYGGTPSYPNSLLYSSPSTKSGHVNFNEGVRTPILQYAHPELGVQPAKASAEDESDTTSDDNGVNSSNSYELEPHGNEDLEGTGRYHQGQPSYYTNNINGGVEYYKKDFMNYPYSGYYLKQKTEQPFWIRLTESIKDNVQSGFERVQQLTRPVFEPIVEATHKIGHNLGLAPNPSRAQEKVGLIAAPGGSVILPALGLVAGGAALGLGAAAMGRLLQPEEMRALHGGIGYPNDILVIMEESSNGRQQEQRTSTEHRRLKRSLEALDERYLQEIATDVERDSLQPLTSPHLWSDTPCAKKLFCEVMVRQNPDEIMVMEKKMDSLLSMVHPEVVQSVSHHLQEVMSAIKMKQCYKFVCNKRLAIPLI